MGLFGDAFDIGAGATLGNLAVKTGYEATEGILNASEQRMYNQFRMQNFDPVVRQDLKDIMVRGMLQNREYPFPRNEQQKKESFLVRHKVVLISFAVMLLLVWFVMPHISYETQSQVVMAWVGFLMIYGAVKLGKKLKRGGKNLMQASFRPKLIKDGQQYWHVREYIRQAMVTGEVSVNDAIVKISNTELGRQFPDTVDEIEANAFYYRQKLGL